ncbi:hypothetical protein [Sorangium sp. So ce1153]|uniref:hypothetical protein n=1 Tax=Sorangium sp. So ce1153 TaxID=3133333 RepID=UPI003F60C0EF
MKSIAARLESDVARRPRQVARALVRRGILQRRGWRAQRNRAGRGRTARGAGGGGGGDDGGSPCIPGARGENACYHERGDRARCGLPGDLGCSGDAWGCGWSAYNTAFHL